MAGGAAEIRPCEKETGRDVLTNDQCLRRRKPKMRRRTSAGKFGAKAREGVRNGNRGWDELLNSAYTNATDSGSSRAADAGRDRGGGMQALSANVATTRTEKDNRARAEGTAGVRD